MDGPFRIEKIIMNPDLVKIKKKRFKSPNIKQPPVFFAPMWVETKMGHKVAVDLKTGESPGPKTHPYAFARFPLEVITRIYTRTKDGNYGGKDLCGAATSTWSPELVMALVSRKKLPLAHAIIIAACSCERCMNILAWQCGLKWGYSPRSVCARKIGTSCDLCR